MDRIERIKEFLKQTPRDSFLRHALALEYIKLGEGVKARQLFMQLLTDDPGYVGSYYHLAKLLEQLDDKEAALIWYEKGMVKAKEKNDQHAYAELQSAYDELVD